MTAFERKAQALFERFTAGLARLDVTRAVALPVALGAVVALAGASLPAHAQALASVTGTPVVSASSPAAQADTVYGRQVLAAMTPAQRDSLAQSLSMQRADSYWRRAHHAQVPDADPTLARVNTIMQKLAKVDAAAASFQVLVFDNADFHYKALGLDGQRIMVEKNWVDGLSDAGLAFMLADALRRVEEHRPVQAMAAMLDAAQADARAAGADPQRPGAISIGSWQDLQDQFATAVGQQSKAVELTLDAHAAALADAAGFDGVAGAKECIVHLVGGTALRPSQTLRIAALEQSRKAPGQGAQHVTEPGL